MGCVQIGGEKGKEGESLNKSWRGGVRKEANEVSISDCKAGIPRDAASTFLRSKAKSITSGCFSSMAPAKK